MSSQLRRHDEHKFPKMIRRMAVTSPGGGGGEALTRVLTLTLTLTLIYSNTLIDFPFKSHTTIVVEVLHNTKV